MANAKKELEIVISARDEASKALRGFSSQLKSFAKNSAIASAGILAVGFGITKLVKRAGKIQSIADAYGSMVEDMGLSGDELIANVKKATSGTMSEFDIMTSFLKAKTLIGTEALGEEAENFERFAVIAKKSARATGADVNFMFESIVTGIGRTSTKWLDNTGIVISATEAYKTYAEELGKTTEELTEQEKKIAVTTAFLEKAETTYESVAVTAGGVSSSFARMRVATEELGDSLGLVLEPAFKELLETITPIIEVQGPKAIEIIRKLMVAFQSLPGPVKVAIVLLIALLPILTALGAVLIVVQAAILALASPIILIGALITGIFIVAILAAIAVLNRLKKGIKIWKEAAIFAFNIVKNAVEDFAEKWIEKFNSIRNAVNSVIDAIGKLISKAREIGGNIGGALGFQHGGTVPGGFGEATPAILHGGERVIPRTGTDVNQPASGGGGVTINLTVEGDVNSIETLETIIDGVRSALGRDNELATQGVAI